MDVGQVGRVHEIRASGGPRRRRRCRRPRWCARTDRKTAFRVLFSEAVKKSRPASRLPKLLMTSVPPGRSTRRMEAKASRVSRCEGEESPRKASRMTASYCLRQRFRKWRPSSSVRLSLLVSQVEEADGHGHHGGVDLHHVHARALAGELHRHDADAQADAEHVVDVGGVGPRQARERVGESGDAELAVRVVGVLDQAVVQVEPVAAVAPVHHLEHAEVRVAPE